jgi:hypothetical protein
VVRLDAAWGSPRPPARWVPVCGVRRQLALGWFCRRWRWRVPSLAGGDDGVQLARQRGGEHGVGLAGGQLVVLAAGQVGEPGGVDGVGFQRAPDRPPGCQAQRRAALPRRAGSSTARSRSSARGGPPACPRAGPHPGRVVMSRGTPAVELARVKVTYPEWRIEHGDGGYTAQRVHHGRTQFVLRADAGRAGKSVVRPDD